MKISEIKQRLDYIYMNLCSKLQWTYIPSAPRAPLEWYIEKIEGAIESLPVGN